MTAHSSHHTSPSNHQDGLEGIGQGSRTSGWYDREGHVSMGMILGVALGLAGAVCVLTAQVKAGWERLEWKEKVEEPRVRTGVDHWYDQHKRVLREQWPVAQALAKERGWILSGLAYEWRAEGLQGKQTIILEGLKDGAGVQRWSKTWVIGVVPTWGGNNGVTESLDPIKTEVWGIDTSSEGKDSRWAEVAEGIEQSTGGVLRESSNAVFANEKVAALEVEVRYQEPLRKYEGHARIIPMQTRGSWEANMKWMQDHGLWLVDKSTETPQLGVEWSVENQE